MDKIKRTPEEKIGQLFMIGVEGTDIDGAIINLLTTYRVGGICYRNSNVKNPKQVHHFSQRLQSYADKQHPLFIAMQQGGGALNTLTQGLTPYPDQKELGSVNNRLYTKRMAQYIGSELYEMGINLNLAPNLEPATSDVTAFSHFSEDLDLVAKHGRSAIEGFQKESVLAAPGYFPENAQQMIEENPIQRTAVHPFDYCIRHGADAILTNTTVDTAPTLRGQLKFNGLIIQQLAGTPTEAAAQAIASINAGADILLYQDSYDNQIHVMETVLEAYQNNEIQEASLEETLDRIAAIKTKYVSKEFTAFDRHAFASEKRRAFAAKLHAASH